MDRDVVVKSVGFGVISAIFAAVFCGVILATDCPEGGTIVALGIIAIVAAWVIFSVFAYIVEGGEMDDLIPRIIVFALLIGAGIAVLFAAIFLLQSTLVVAKDQTSDVHFAVMALIAAPLCGGLGSMGATVLIAGADEEASVIKSALAYVGAYILSIISFLIFSADVAALIIMGLACVLGVFDLVVIGRWIKEFFFG